VLQQTAGGDAVLHLVGLGPGPPHGHASAPVEDTEMDPRGVNEAAHHTAEGIQLAHHVAFAHAANAGIAAHLANLIEVHGEQGGVHAHAGSYVRSLNPGMPPPDDHHLPHQSPKSAQDTLPPESVPEVAGCEKLGPCDPA